MLLKGAFRKKFSKFFRMPGEQDFTDAQPLAEIASREMTNYERKCHYDVLIALLLNRLVCSNKRTANLRPHVGLTFDNNAKCSMGVSN